MFSREKGLKFLAPAMLGGNLASGVMGIAYAVSPTYNLVWDIFGVILLVTLFGNLLLVYLLDVVVDKTTPQCKRLNQASYLVLLGTLLGMVGILGGNFLLSSSYSNALADVWGLYAYIFACFFGQLAIAGYLALLTWKYVRAPFEKVTEPAASRERDRHRKLRIITILACGFAIGFLTYLAVLVVLGPGINVWEAGESAVFNGFAGVMGGMFGGFWCFMALAAALMLVKVTRRYHHPRVSTAIALVGVVISAIMFVPLVATPSYAAEADARFAAAFGADWQSRIPSGVQSYFLPTRFVVPGYYLGIPAKDCVVLKDQLFHTGTGVEAGLRLYFDAYLPPNGGASLPGKNSTLIRIHGGGWMIGDKGPGNMLQDNKYFAAQGYCVFDIQYGLNNNSDMLAALSFINPPYLMGNFSVNDMIGHIGIFCNYLITHNVYGANLSSVFVSGGSAGGHLTCATALAIANGTYTSYFDAGLTIRGVIPYYPGNGGARFIDGNVSLPEFYDPESLVTSASPPCLIYQGAGDALVPPTISQNLQAAYTATGNTECALLLLPLGGHGSDIYFSGFYNTFFLYYMERFMYLYR